MRRLGASLLLIVVIAVIGAGWVVDRLFDRLGPAAGDPLSSYRTLGRELVALLESGGDGDGEPPVRGDGRGLVLQPRASLTLPPELSAELDAPDGLLLESADGVRLYFALPSSARVLSFAVPTSRARDEPLRWSMTALFYGAIAALVLLWLYPLLRRLRRLAEAARGFGQGDLGRRVETGASSSLHVIESEFNRMAGRIESLVRDNRLLGNAVSHDLRTPLARLRFGIDALAELDGEASPSPEAERDGRRRNYLRRIESDLAAMEDLVGVLLDYARLDRHLQTLPLGPVDLGALVSRAVAARHEEGERNIDWRGNETGAWVRADARYATMLINNLLDNALRHGRGAVRVRLAPGAGTITLGIEDDGEGIPAARRDEVLKPFVRDGEPADGRGRTGYGLGLAIVARIAEWHGADLRIGTGRVLGGARIDVAFARAEP